MRGPHKALNNSAPCVAKPLGAQGNPGIASSSEASESEHQLDSMLRRKVDLYGRQRNNAFCGKQVFFWEMVTNGFLSTLQIELQLFQQASV